LSVSACNRVWCPRNSPPLTNAGYLGIKTAAIAAAFVLTAGLMVAGSFVFYGRQFGFYAFQEFLNPLAVFLLPSALFILGLSLAVGQLHPRLPYGLLPVIFFAGVLNLGLPQWLDLSGNGYLFNYPKILMRTLGTGEMVYHLTTSFLTTRAGLAVAGVTLLLWAARRRGR
jgi:hypothetical protein